MVPETYQVVIFGLELGVWTEFLWTTALGEFVSSTAENGREKYEVRIGLDLEQELQLPLEN